MSCSCCSSKYITDKYGNSADFAPPVIIPKGASFTDMVALKGKSDIGDRINIHSEQFLALMTRHYRWVGAIRWSISCTTTYSSKSFGFFTSSVLMRMCRARSWREARAELNELPLAAEVWNK